MGADVSVTVSLVQLERMQAQVQTRATAIIRKLAMDVEAEAKRTVPVDTGTLKASITAFERRRALWWVATNVEYAPWVEFGTSHMGARPYLVPAAERIRPAFRAAWDALLRM